MKSKTQENMYAKVIQLFITKNDTLKTRESVKSIQLDTQGVQTDKFYNKDSQRSILLTATQSYELAEENGIKLSFGDLGENILIDINPYHLQAGNKLKIGAVELEITQNCTLCQGLSTLDTKLPKLLKTQRGIFAKISQGTFIISVGDKVEISNH